MGDNERRRAMEPRLRLRRLRLGRGSNPGLPDLVGWLVVLGLTTL